MKNVAIRLLGSAFIVSFSCGTTGTGTQRQSTGTGTAMKLES
jgi:hypothetical protein